MAPRKPAPDRPSATTIPTKTSKNRLSKPKRVFHKYRNGLLNLKPKGKYIQMVKSNQEQSPLLRLPAEIRNQIFEYALGGKTWKIGVLKRVGATNKKKNALNLLGVCRQIYAETAVIPFQASAFKASNPHNLCTWLLAMSRARREAITTICLVDMYSFLGSGVFITAYDNLAMHIWGDLMTKLLPKLPGLKRIRVDHYAGRCENSKMALASILNYAKQSESKLENRVRALVKDVEVTFERKDLLGV